tara:strand:- start:635 stop:820 length:186 start_codon:yes stop_codon:yes gene_type:complete
VAVKRAHVFTYYQVSDGFVDLSSQLEEKTAEDRDRCIHARSAECGESESELMDLSYSKRER